MMQLLKILGDIDEAFRQRDMDTVFLLLCAPELQDIKREPLVQANWGALFLALLTKEAVGCIEIPEDWESINRCLNELRGSLLGKETMAPLQEEVLLFWIEQVHRALKADDDHLLLTTVEFFEYSVFTFLSPVLEKSTLLIYTSLERCIVSEPLRTHGNARCIPHLLFSIGGLNEITEKVAMVYKAILLKAVDVRFQDATFFLSLMEVSLQFIHFPFIVELLIELRLQLLSRQSEFLYISDLLCDTGNLQR